MLVSEFDYNLPEELIAQTPSKKRDECKMMVLDKNLQTIEHKHFYDIINYLDENHILILNNTKVIPARLFGHKSTGALIEVFLLKDKGQNHWEALIKPSKRIKPQTEITISEELKIIAIENLDDGKWIIELKYDGILYEILNKIDEISGGAF